MKKHLLVLFSVFVLLFSSCTKKICCTLQPIKDFIIAEKDGAQWSVNPLNSNLLGDTATIAGSQPNEAITIKIALGGTGYYPLKSTEAYYIIKKDDVIIKKYTISPTYYNAVNVISYNQKDKILQGLFNIKFIKTFDITPGAPQDSISFLNGKFKVGLHN